MLYRDGTGPLDPRQRNQLTAATDLAEFLDGTHLPYVPWELRDHEALTVAAYLSEGVSGSVVEAYATALNVAPIVRRVVPDQQQLIAYRHDGLNGRTEVMVGLTSPIDCLEQPPTYRTAPYLLAERDWATLAHVRFLREPHDGEADEVEPWQRGQTALMCQHGEQLDLIDPGWVAPRHQVVPLTDYHVHQDDELGFRVPPDAVEVLYVIEYLPPFQPFAQLSAEQVASVREGLVVPPNRSW